MSKTIQNRIKKYQQLLTDHNSVIVWSHPHSEEARPEKGIVYSDATPYIGEAGHSERIRVLWADGKLTTCTKAGLIQVGNDYVIRG